MTRAVVHVGLPKTGTTSLQQACFEAAERLASEGILYPRNDWLRFRDAAQHQSLAVRVAQGTPESIDEDVRKLRELSEGYDTLLVSAERFATSLRDPGTRAALEAFRTALNRRFDRVDFVVAIRDDRRLLCSTLRTKIDATGLKSGPDFIRTEIESFYEMNRTLIAALGDQLKVLRFEELVAGSFPTSLFQACTGRDLSLPDVKWNASGAKDARRFLMSNVRTLLFHVLGEPMPNTPTINQAARALEEGIVISPEVNAKLRTMLDGWIEKEVDAALAEAKESLEEIYAPLLAPPVES